MKREVIFRGQRIDNGEWVYGFLYQLPLPTGVGCMILTTDNTHEDNSINPKYHLAFTLWVDLFPVKPDTVGQFTGAKDKNGNDIFEGDIVHWKNSYGYSFTKAVGHDDAHGRFTPMDIFIGYGCEVLGNIYDNPELLHTK